MPLLNPEALAKLESFRSSAKVEPWTATEITKGVWRGGRLYCDEWGDEVFIPLDVSRATVKQRRLTFLGDALQDTKGFAPFATKLIVPVEVPDGN